MARASPWAALLVATAHPDSRERKEHASCSFREGEPQSYAKGNGAEGPPCQDVKAYGGRPEDEAPEHTDPETRDAADKCACHSVLCCNRCTPPSEKALALAL